MELTLPLYALLCALFFLVAFLYASVGHGGASGYLAVLSIFAFAPREMGTTALLLNILVAGIAFATYYKEGFFTSRLTLPFLLGSVPFAFLGGALATPPGVYTILLSLALVVAGVRLFVRITPPDAPYKLPSYTLALPIGGAIGLISGIVGVGGGIFLSPVILLSRWSDPKHTAATSACFIVVNSLAGILGRQVAGTFSFGSFLPLMIAAGLGGILGATWGSKRSTNLLLQRLLGVALLIAAVKLVVTFLNR